MHEHSFIEAILKDVNNRDDVNRITLEVGELAGIEGEHLKRHIMERFNWAVEIIERMSKVKCECGFEGRARILERLHDLVIFECAQCGWVPEVLEGKDIKILKIIYK